MNDQPPPGHAGIAMGSYGRVVFTPPETLPPRTLSADGAFQVEELKDGRALLIDQSGESWGVFTNKGLAEGTAERLSR